MKTKLAFALTLLVVACAGDDVAVTLEPGTTALTDKGGDSLFSLKIGETGKDLALDNLKVKAKLDGKDAIELTATVNDANANSKLDQGDTITCTEPAANTFDGTSAGKEVSVELFHADERLAETTWTVVK
jgi:hypothetical protein